MEKLLFNCPLCSTVQKTLPGLIKSFLITSAVMTRQCTPPGHLSDLNDIESSYILICRVSLSQFLWHNDANGTLLHRTTLTNNLQLCPDAAFYLTQNVQYCSRKYFFFFFLLYFVFWLNLIWSSLCLNRIKSSCFYCISTTGHLWWLSWRQVRRNHYHSHDINQRVPLASVRAYKASLSDAVGWKHVGHVGMTSSGIFLDNVNQQCHQYKFECSIIKGWLTMLHSYCSMCSNFECWFSCSTLLYLLFGKQINVHC